MHPLTEDVVTDGLFDVDWGSVFAPEPPPLKIIVRGTVVYLALFALLRLVLRREAGAVGITDLLVAVLIADAAQNAVGDDYRSIPDGLLLVATIVFWSLVVNWLGFRFPRIQRLVHPAPLALVKNGRMLRKNMAQALITEDELMSQLRLQGASDVSQVASALMEGDGRISVIMQDGPSNGAPDRPLACPDSSTADAGKICSVGPVQRRYPIACPRAPSSPRQIRRSPDTSVWILQANPVQHRHGSHRLHRAAAALLVAARKMP